MPPTPLLRTILQTSPGEYNEAVFKGLDYVLDEARKRGIRVSSCTGLAGVPSAAGCVPLLSAAPLPNVGTPRHSSARLNGCSPAAAAQPDRQLAADGRR